MGRDRRKRAQRALPRPIFPVAPSTRAVASAARSPCQSDLLLRPLTYAEPQKSDGRHGMPLGHGEEGGEGPMYIEDMLCIVS